MNNKIPPPIVGVLSALAIYFSRSYLPEFVVPFAHYVSVAVGLSGVLIAVWAVRSFNKSRTTINPLKPKSASSLVTHGIFRITRNPMYLGMALLLGGIAIYFNPIGGLIFVPLFVWFITTFQILPEEAAMHSLFGEQFSRYKKDVRRWI